MEISSKVKEKINENSVMYIYYNFPLYTMEVLNAARCRDSRVKKKSIACLISPSGIEKS